MPKRSSALSGLTRPKFDFRFGGRTLCLGRETKIMGVLNVTPDSFSDGGFYLKPETAARRALQMEEEGAHLIDVGGESSRPGSQPVSAKEEIQRIRPVLKILAKKIKIPLSVDTAKYDVALAALDEGAEVINDITALRQDKKLGKLIARYKAGIVLMHMRGTPQTMQTQPIYRDVLKDAAGFLKKAVTRALDAGIARSSIILDPGFGFGKKLEHNLTLLSRFDFFQSLRLPLLAGLSRKSFIGGLLDVPVGERLAGSLAAASVAIHRGAHMLRVHDVRAHRQLCLIIDAALAGREAA